VSSGECSEHAPAADDYRQNEREPSISSELQITTPFRYLDKPLGPVHRTIVRHGTSSTGTEARSKARKAAMDVTLDRSLGNPHDLGHLSLTEAVEIPKCQYFTLSAW